VTHVVQGIPQRVVHILSSQDLRDHELDPEDGSVVEEVLVEVLAGGAEADRLGVALLPIRARDSPRPRHVLPNIVTLQRATRLTRV
jgi:hypothetical protein